MPDEHRTNRARSGAFGAAALAFVAICGVYAQRVEGPSSQAGAAQAGAPNGVPLDLGPSESFKGVPWIGQAPVTITVDELMDRESRATPISPRRSEQRAYTL